MVALLVSWMRLDTSGQCFEARLLAYIEKVLFWPHLLRRTYWQLIAAGEMRLILLEGVSSGRIGSHMHTHMSTVVDLFLKKKKYSL